MIHLEAVSRENFRQVASLAVADHQNEFVATNAYSIAEASVFPAQHPLVVFHGDEPVGFCMWAKDSASGQYWVVRLMIDARFQGRGFGRAAMEKLLALMRAEGARDQIYVSFVPGNAVARNLYASMGFLDTGRIEDDETVFVLPFVSDKR